MLLVLAAFLGQSIVTQSHVHVPGGALSSGVETLAESSGKIALSATHAPADVPAGCPLCRELAAAGHYLAPAPVALPAGLAPVFWLFVLPAAVILARQRSHRWQSRAPPR